MAAWRRALWQHDAKPVEECRLGGVGLGDAAQANRGVVGFLSLIPNIFAMKRYMEKHLEAVPARKHKRRAQSARGRRACRALRMISAVPITAIGAESVMPIGDTREDDDGGTGSRAPSAAHAAGAFLPRRGLSRAGRPCPWPASERADCLVAHYAGCFLPLLFPTTSAGT